jgi:hypothetical protein
MGQHMIMGGTLQVAFRPDSLEITCTNVLRVAQAVEIGELLHLANSYYYLREIHLRLLSVRASRAACSFLQQSLAAAKDVGLMVHLHAPSALSSALHGTDLNKRKTRRPIGFGEVPKSPRRTRGRR